MNTALSIFQRMLGRLGKLNATRQASLDIQVPHVAAAGTSRPSRLGGAGAASKVTRTQRIWQWHGEAAQTPSNLM
jgi:hypothetical protein